MPGTLSPVQLFLNQHFPRNQKIKCIFLVTEQTSNTSNTHCYAANHHHVYVALSMLSLLPILDNNWFLAEKSVFLTLFFFPCIIILHTQVLSHFPYIIIQVFLWLLFCVLLGKVPWTLENAMTSTGRDPRGNLRAPGWMWKLLGAEEGARGHPSPPVLEQEHHRHREPSPYCCPEHWGSVCLPLLTEN